MRTIFFQADTPLFRIPGKYLLLEKDQGTDKENGMDINNNAISQSLHSASAD